jgi:hypothetical protein
MTEIQFNDKGIPLMAYGKSYLAVTSGSPSEKAPKVSRSIERLDSEYSLGNYFYSPWGANNDFPFKALDTIGKTGVLNTGLKYIRNFTLGQGVYPVRVIGYLDNGDEKLEVVNDPALVRFLNGRTVRRYMANACRDFLKFGICFPELLPNADGSKIVGINTINASHCRLTVANDSGLIENCLVSGEWAFNTPGEGKYSVIPVLDGYDPAYDLYSRKLMGKVGRQSFIYPLKDEWGNEDYYPYPAWYSAYRAGWVDVANKVPAFLSKAFENQITWLWHIKIPYAYWERKYPENKYNGVEARQSAVQTEMNAIEEAIVGTKNANKAIFSMYEVNSQGKPEEQWIIEPLENKYKEGDKLVSSAAANSEILFSLMINPNVMGAGMPGGVYSGNQGGSNIREAFLVNIANAWLDRQSLLDPIECMLQYNGVKDIELRFRNTILTTLDTGAGTQKNLA